MRKEEKKAKFTRLDYEPKKKKSAARLSENILMRVTGNRAIFMDGLAASNLKNKK